jgi:hypothetical protein
MTIGLRIIPELATAAFIAWATMTAPGNRVHFLLTLLLIYGAGKLLSLGIRKLWGRARRT